MSRKKALITGITGQDGSYLTELLLNKGYEVYGFMRRKSSDPFSNFSDPKIHEKINVIYGDLRDINAVVRLFDKVVPDEIYNLAAQSHVGVSFSCPEETMEINYYGVGRIVNEAMKRNKNVRIYQASTSEMFGSTPPPQNENSIMDPVSPYAEAKLKAHQDYVVGYREKHGLYICSGILFNHESPRRGLNFVTRKITHSLVKIKLGLQEVLELGNLNAKRDWGFAGDYVEMMWKMLQQDKPDDFVIATGKMHTVRDLINFAAKELDMKINFEGEGENEVGKDENGKVIIKVNPDFYRPVETNDLQGDITKAKEKIGWEPKTSFEELVAMMVKGDMEEIKIKHNIK